MSKSVRKVGFIGLPDDQLEVLSAMTGRQDYRPEVIIDDDTNAYSYKLAEILQIPTSANGSILKVVPCDILVIPDGCPELREEMAIELGPKTPRIISASEMAIELGLDPSAKAAEEAAYVPSDWGVGVPSPDEDDRTFDNRTFSEAAHNDATFNEGTLDDTELVIERLADEEEVTEPPPTIPAAPAPSAPSPANTAAETSLQQAAETLKLAFDKQKLLRHIRQIAVNAARGDSGSIMLLDETGEYLKIAVAEGLSGDIVRRTRQRVGEGVAGNVLLEGRARVIIDKLNDPRYRTGRERSAIKAAVCVPIRVADRSIGVLNVSSDTRMDGFNENTMCLLEKFGAEVALVIIQALGLSPARVDSAEEALRSRIETHMAMSASLPSKLDAVAGAIGQFLGAGACRVYFNEARGKRLKLMGEYGQGFLRPAHGTTSADHGLIGWALKLGRPEAFAPLYGESERRAVFYFLLRGKTPLGIIEVEGVPLDDSNRTEAFEAMEHLSSRLASLIEHDQSSALLTRRTQQMLRLSELIAEMSQDKALDGLVDLAVKSSAELFGASLATLRLFPDGTLAMSDEHFPEKDPLAERLLSFDEHISRQAIKQNEVLTLANMPPSHEELVAGLPQVQWMSILPLNCGEGYEGVLSLYGMTRESQDPKGDELLMIEKFRSYLGRSLGKALAQGGAGERFMRWTAFREKLEEEFKRANRYGRSFVVTIVDIDGWAQASAANGRDWNEGARYALTEFIWHHVRDVDVPAWIQEGRIAILCPEIQGGSEALARRLEAEWANLVPGLKLKDMDTMQFKAREIHFPGMTRQLDEIIARIIQPEHGDQERSLTA